MKKSVRFQDEVHEFIQKYMEYYKCNYSKAVNSIILEYRQLKRESSNSKKLDRMLDAIHELLKEGHN